jgi:LL-diaminopimelate aminotransferase
MNAMKTTPLSFRLSSRLEGIGEYYFSTKLREIDELNRQGKAIINLGIGSPDLPPHPSVIQALQEKSSLSSSHGYQNYKGIPALREAMSAWYQRNYGVQLDPASEILPLMGSKEGILHTCMTYLQAGDEALIPNPGYPTYRSAVQLAGATPVEYTLLEKNNWSPDWTALEKTDLSRVKLMWVNYPHMPTGQNADTALFQQIIDFGRKHGILICHDNPYSFILNEKPQSILEIDGALDVAIELNSLSKSHNMAGWRVGMLSGAAERINEVLRFKSNMDSGMFLPVQLAAVAALQLDHSWYNAVNVSYSARRKKAMELLRLIGCEPAPGQSGLFLWSGIPAGDADAYALSDRILYGAGVFLTPGGIFGSAGNQYVRISLCASEEKMEEAIQRIKIHGSGN